MRPRQSITEVFSTFLQFDTDRVVGWATDAKLRRNMLKCQSNRTQAESSEKFWAMYWYKTWHKESDGLAKLHLSAYLQEVCYWAAQKTAASFSTGQYTVSDCFQMAIARVDKVLKGFDPQIGFNLSNYASVIFSSELKEILRQQHEVDICTNWRLLRKLTQKRLVESLQNLGLSGEIERYVLTWKCFQSKYVPIPGTGSRKLPKPDQQTWEAIATLYNTQRQQLSQPGPEATKEIVEKWMIACAKAVRSYLYPNFSSLNAPKGEEGAGEFIDNLTELKQESLLTEIIAEEEEIDRKSQQTDINTVLVAALSQLDAQAQTILQLYYSQGLTQQQIALDLGIKQYTISRRLTKARESLLLKLATWSKDKFNTNINSTVLNYISNVMDEWLRIYYTNSVT